WHRREGDAGAHPDRLARPDARGGELADALLPAAARQPDRVLHPPRVRAAHPEGSRRARPAAPHEPHVRPARRRGGLRHRVDPPAPPRRAGLARAGRLRSRGRGAAPRVRDPRDRPRPALAALDPPGLDPRTACLMAPPVLALSNVRVSYGGADVLDVGALEVAEGAVLAVIEPNGSGKSTLLRVAGLLERPTTGRVSFRQRVVDAAHALAERRRMAMVFQQPLLADMTVAENAALGLAFRGVGADLCEARVGRWLERLNIAPLRGRRAAQGGGRSGGRGGGGRGGAARAAGGAARVGGGGAVGAGGGAARGGGGTGVAAAGRMLGLAGPAGRARAATSSIRPEDVT